jgi:hypothetical protein
MKKEHNKRSNNSEGSGTSMSNTNCHKIEHECWAWLAGHNTKYNQTQNTLFSVVLHVVLMCDGVRGPHHRDAKGKSCYLEAHNTYHNQCKSPNMDTVNSSRAGNW